MYYLLHYTTNNLFNEVVFKSNDRDKVLKRLQNMPKRIGYFKIVHLDR